MTTPRTGRRLLILLGSGETSPTMVTPHQQWFAALEAATGGPVPAVLLDTPYGFQANRGDLNAKAVRYFGTSVGRPVTVASYRTEPEGSAVDALAEQTALEQVRAARWIFAGPGSPTYALRRWGGTPLADALVDTLAPGGPGGAVLFASAAALTLGAVTVPVYEIYKSGELPAWRTGLDVVGRVLGWTCAVVPHYDNTEGGNHDTRFCYLGEPRLRHLEQQLPEGAFVLGIDEHTGLVCDLDAGTATVVGRGGVTVRVAGRSSVLRAGSTVPLTHLAALARGGGAVDAAEPGVPVAADPAADGPAEAMPSLATETARCQAAFDAALAGRDVDGAVRAVLALDDAVAGWSTDTLQGEDADRARAALRGMVVRLGQLARTGAADPRDVVGPFVELLLEARRNARAGKRYAEADALRDELARAGIEVRDTADGAEWHLVVG
ncbi:MAG: hypothetical protein JWM48_3256 [Mycobacterium sp.]|nr:hypothetical protein [Mycobacterium sp.]